MKPTRTAEPVRLAGVRRLARALFCAAAAIRSEQGQAATEYALFSFFLMMGSGAALLVFLPQAFNAYKTYISGFYMVLRLPIP